MNQSFFIDGIENIALAEGVVRMDCIVIELGPENKTVGRRTASLAMPLSGFLRSAERFNQVTTQLIEQGVIKKRGDVAPAVAEKQKSAPAKSTSSRKK
jgi:hypothetical protein